MGVLLRIKYFTNKIFYFFSTTKSYPTGFINRYVSTTTRSLSSTGTSHLSAANIPASTSTASKDATLFINQVLLTETPTCSCSQWYVYFYASYFHITIFSNKKAKTAKDVSNRCFCCWHTSCSPRVSNIQPTKP